MKKIIIIFMVLLTINLYGEENKGQTTKLKQLDTLVDNKESVNNRKVFDVEGNKYIIRPLFGIATPSSLEEILVEGGHKKDPDNGRMIGIQVERYVSKRPFNFPVNITLQSSFIVHTNSYDKNGSGTKPEDSDYYTNKDSHQINFGIKIYWTQFPWDKYVRTRFGVSEGLSYVDRITNLERRNQYRKNNSNYLNYIDMTMSFNARDISRLDYLENTYIGIGISHRSGIFGTINGVVGGSNNITFFFETEI